MKLRLLGMMAAERDGQDLPLPASRKTRAILGYLVLSPRPVSRQRLCDLFFDLPDDPRAALRWSLHKLRQLLDADGTIRIRAERDQLAFVPDGVTVDVLDVLTTGAEPEDTLDPARIDACLALLQDQLMEDADLPNRLDYSTWLSGWRQDLARLEARLLAGRVRQLAGDPARQVPYLQRWRLVEPQEEAVHARLIEALVLSGRRDEAIEAATIGERALRELGLSASPALRAGLRNPARPPLVRTSAGKAGPAGSGPDDFGSTQVPDGQAPAHLRDSPDTAMTTEPAVKPVVVVLPLTDLSGTPLPAHIPAGFTDGLTHALSRFRSLIVLSHASADRLAGQLEDPVAIADAVGADVLVGGSLAASGDGRLRMRWRVLEGRSGRILSVGDIEGRLDDLWDFQEQAASSLAVEVEPRAQKEAVRARADRPTTDPAAYDFYLQALYAGFSLEGRDYARALDLLERAMALDPRLHQALAFAPWAAAYANRIASRADLARFADMSRQALRIGRDDARTLATAGTALFYMAHEFGPARAAINRAIELNPNEYTAWICGGWMDAMKGGWASAHAMFDRAERLNPLAYGANGLMSGRAMADFMIGRLADAERFIELALAGDDSHPSALMTGIATASGLGLDEKLRHRSRGFLGIYPDGIGNLAIQALPFEDPACRARYFDAVQAGLDRAGT